jgi:hypothetical protein
LEDPAADSGRHSLTKAVDPLAAALLGLIGALGHNILA